VDQLQVCFQQIKGYCHMVLSLSSSPILNIEKQKNKFQLSTDILWPAYTGIN